MAGRALYDRQVDNAERLVHHRDRGGPYLSIRYTARLAGAGIELSVGGTGDSYDNALAGSVIGLFKTEVLRRGGPWRHLDDVEFAGRDSTTRRASPHRGRPEPTATSRRGGAG